MEKENIHCCLTLWTFNTKSMLCQEHVSMECTCENAKNYFHTSLTHSVLFIDMIMEQENRENTSTAGGKYNPIQVINTCQVFVKR